MTFAAEQGDMSATLLSIVIPTRNEAGNVRPLLERLQRAVGDWPIEVIFVDDSSDDTPEVIQKTSLDVPFEVTLLVRPPGRRNGLGKAVVEGIRVARSPWICVMDGDLQHPPEVIPELLACAEQSGANLVAASRLSDGGSVAGLSFRRRIVSWALALFTRATFPARLKQMSDPLTGFFLVERDLLDPDRLDPEGFKILLEILLRTPDVRGAEVPFTFGERHAGTSKANTREAVLLLRQVLRLGLQSYAHLLRFLTVGFSGLLVNTGLLALFTELFHWHYLLAAVAATQGSTLWNFLWSEGWVFRDRVRLPTSIGNRLMSYFLLNNGALLLRGPLLAVLVSWLGLYYLLANLITLFVMTLFRFGISDHLIWRHRGRDGLPEAANDPLLTPITSIMTEEL